MKNIILKYKVSFRGNILVNIFLLIFFILGSIYFYFSPKIDTAYILLISFFSMFDVVKYRTFIGNFDLTNYLVAPLSFEKKFFNLLIQEVTSEKVLFLIIFLTFFIQKNQYNQNVHFLLSSFVFFIFHSTYSILFTFLLRHIPPFRFMPPMHFWIILLDFDNLLKILERLVRIIQQKYELIILTYIIFVLTILFTMRKILLIAPFISNQHIRLWWEKNKV